MTRRGGDSGGAGDADAAVVAAGWSSEATVPRPAWTAGGGSEHVRPPARGDGRMSRSRSAALRCAAPPSRSRSPLVGIAVLAGFLFCFVLSCPASGWPAVFRLV